MDEKKRRLICELHKGGYKWQQIIDRVGISRATILKVIKAEKLSRRRTKLNESLRKEILELVRKGDQSTAEIAKQFNICTASVDRIRLKATESPVTEEQRKMILQMFHRGCSRADIIREVKVDGDAAYAVIRSALAAQRKLSVSQSQQEEILNCFDEGRTREHILKKFGISETTLKRVLQQKGKTFQERSLKNYEERQASVLKLRAKGLTMTAIAKKLKITTGAVFNILQKNCDKAVKAPIVADGLPLGRVTLEMDSSTDAGEQVVRNPPIIERGDTNIAVGCRRSARVTALQQRNPGCKRKSVYAAHTSESEASDAETSEAESDASDAVISGEETETSDAEISEPETDTDAEDSNTETEISGVGTSGFESSCLGDGPTAQQPAVIDGASVGCGSTHQDGEAHHGNSTAQPKHHKMNEKNKQLICELYKSGSSWKEITNRVGINIITLHKFIKAAKLPRRRTGLTELQKNEITKLAREGTLSPEEIAKRFSISVLTVERYRRMTVTNAQKKSILQLYHRGSSIIEIMKEVKLGEKVCKAVISRISVQRKKISVSRKKKKEILKCFEEGLGGLYIQEKFGISENTLNWILLQNGKSLKDRCRNSYQQRRADIQKLRAEGLTMRAIAKQLKLSVRTISIILKKNWEQEAIAPEVLLSRKSPAMDSNNVAEEEVDLTPRVDEDGGSNTVHGHRRSARLAMQQRVPGSECERCCNSDCVHTFESNPDERTSNEISEEPSVCTAAVKNLPSATSISLESTTTNTHGLQDARTSEAHALESTRSLDKSPIAQPAAVTDMALPTMTVDDENQDDTASQCGSASMVTHSGDSVAGYIQHGSPNLGSSVFGSETARMPGSVEVNELRDMGSQNAAAAHSHHAVDITDPHQPLSRANEARNVTPSPLHNVADSEPPIVPVGNIAFTEEFSLDPASGQHSTAARNDHPISTVHNQQLLAPIEPRDSSPERQNNEPPIMPTSSAPNALPDLTVQERETVTDRNKSPYRELQSIVLKLREHGCSYEVVRRNIKTCFLSTATSTGDAEMPGTSREDLPQDRPSPAIHGPETFIPTTNALRPAETADVADTVLRGSVIRHTDSCCASERHRERSSHDLPEVSSHGEQQRNSCDDVSRRKQDLTNAGKIAGITERRVRRIVRSGPRRQLCNPPTAFCVLASKRAKPSQRPNGPASEDRRATTSIHHGDSMAEHTPPGSPNLCPPVCRSEKEGAPGPPELNEDTSSLSVSTVYSHQILSVSTMDQRPQPDDSEACSRAPECQHNMANSEPPVESASNDAVEQDIHSRESPVTFPLPTQPSTAILEDDICVTPVPVLHVCRLEAEGAGNIEQRSEAAVDHTNTGPLLYSPQLERMPPEDRQQPHVTLEKADSLNRESRNGDASSLPNDNCAVEDHPPHSGNGSAEKITNSDDCRATESQKQVTASVCGDNRWRSLDDYFGMRHCQQNSALEEDSVATKVPENILRGTDTEPRESANTATHIPNISAAADNTALQSQKTTNRESSQYREKQFIVLELHQEGCSSDAMQQPHDVCFVPGAASMQDGGRVVEGQDNSDDEAFATGQLSNTQPSTAFPNHETCVTPVFTLWPIETEDALDNGQQRSDTVADPTFVAPIVEPPRPECLPSHLQQPDHSSEPIPEVGVDVGTDTAQFHSSHSTVHPTSSESPIRCAGTAPEMLSLQPENSTTSSVRARYQCQICRLSCEEEDAFLSHLANREHEQLCATGVFLYCIGCKFKTRKPATMGKHIVKYQSQSTLQISDMHSVKAIH